MEHSLDDLGVAKLEELAAHLSELQDSPAGTLATTPSTSGDMANKVSGFRADESYSAVQHWIPRKYGKVDDSVVFSSYRSNKLSAVSSTDFLNMPNFSHKPQAYSSRFRRRDKYNKSSPENSFDREPDHSHKYKSVSPPFYANDDEHSYERSVSSGYRQGKSFQASYRSRSRSPHFSKDHRRRRSSSNSNSDTSTKTFDTSAFRYRSRSPRIFKDRRRRRRSSESSSGSSTTLSPSRITASKVPQIDEDMASLLKRVDEVQKRSKILQAQADISTSTLPHFFSAVSSTAGPPPDNFRQLQGQLSAGSSSGQNSHTRALAVNMLAPNPTVIAGTACGATPAPDLTRIASSPSSTLYSSSPMGKAAGETTPCCAEFSAAGAYVQQIPSMTSMLGTTASGIGNFDVAGTLAALGNDNPSAAISWSTNSGGAGIQHLKSFTAQNQMLVKLGTTTGNSLPYADSTNKFSQTPPSSSNDMPNFAATVNFPAPSFTQAAPGQPAGYFGVGQQPANSNLFPLTETRRAELHSPAFTNVSRHGMAGFIKIQSPNRSQLLAEFNQSRLPNFHLRDLQNHVIQFSQDLLGSRFLQQKLEIATWQEKAIVFQEILPSCQILMTDVFGNYVIQKFLEFGSDEQKRELVKKLKTHVLRLALHKHGCRVIQKVLESSPPDCQLGLLKELEGHILECVKNINGNHVVQKVIECVDPLYLDFVVGSLREQTFALSTHPYGCRVIQCMLKHCNEGQKRQLLDEIHTRSNDLSVDLCGNYVVQLVIEHGPEMDRNKIIDQVRGEVLRFSQHKFASNVIEKCLQYGDAQQKRALITEVFSSAARNKVPGHNGTGNGLTNSETESCGGKGSGSNTPDGVGCGSSTLAGIVGKGSSSRDSGQDTALLVMLLDQYANYVVLKMLDVAEADQRRRLMQAIRPHVRKLGRLTYGRHIISKLRQYFSANIVQGKTYLTTSTAPSCSSTIPVMASIASSEYVPMTSSVAPDPGEASLGEPVSSSLATKEAVIEPTAVSPLPPQRYIPSLPIVTKSSNLITIQPISAANKQIDKFADDSDVRMIGSLEEIIKRFMPNTENTTFNYVGFFMECFQRMSNSLRKGLFDRSSCLRHAVMLINMISMKTGITVKEPACDPVSNIWCYSILLDGNCVSGYGLCQNSAILNALGLTFPEKVADLRDFARHEGFLGWKLARKQYTALYVDQKYDFMRAKFWTELNRVFFVKSVSNEYSRDDDKGQIVYEKLKEVFESVFGDMSFLIRSAGIVCVDVRIVFKIGYGDGEMLTGTHFSVGSACLSLISSMFDVSSQMKFLDDLMLLLCAGSLKRTDYNQVVTDLYFDLVFARSYFVAELCERWDNLDSAVKRLMSGYAGKERITVLQCLVADDAFYYNLLGWFFGQRLTTNSYETQQFLKMWSISSIRCNRSINMCQQIKHGSKSNKSWIIDWILRKFTDYRIFTGKVCQSSYAWSMVDYLLSRVSFDQELYEELQHYVNLMEDNITIDPYGPLCPQVILGEDARPLVYENSSSITGLRLTRERSEKRADFIRLTCQLHEDYKLVEIIRDICDSKQGREFDDMLDVASRDVLYVAAIEQPMSHCSSIKREWWHIRFWQSLALEALEMPDLRIEMVTAIGYLQGWVKAQANAKI